MYFEKSTVDVATVVKLRLCIVCPSTFHPVRLLNSTLSPFSQNGQAVRMQTMQNSLSRINRLIPFFTVKLLSAALRAFPLPSLFFYTQLREWFSFSLSPFRCYAIYENIFLPKWTSYYWRQNWALDEDSKKGFSFAVGRSQAEIFKLLLFCLIWSDK